MVTARNKWLTLAFGLVVAGGTLFWPPGSPAEDPPRPAVAQGRLQGRFTAADTGKPVAGAKVRVSIHGVPGKAKVSEALSGPDGRYELDVPLGHINLWGIHAPAGYFTQDPKTYGPVLTTATESQITRDFLLNPGAAWRVEVQGAAIPADHPPLFSAAPDPDVNPNGYANSADVIGATSDARGRGVLTIPTGDRYRLSCILMRSSKSYEIPYANVEMDDNFDPRRIKGNPELVPEIAGAVRLRDTAGRSALVEGVDVLVDAGQAVLRFPAKAIPVDEALMLRGSAVDEAGKPIEGAKFAAAISQVFAKPPPGPGPAAAGRAFMIQLEATTDAHGKFELPRVLLPAEWFTPEYKIQMLAVKSGFDGVQTEKLNLLDVRKAGSADFGTVVLSPGHTLRGKVVDEKGLPVHGALIRNHSGSFIYSHLACRTDAQGHFSMPDLGKGTHNLTAAYGARYAQADLDSGSPREDNVVHLRLPPKAVPPGLPR